MTKYSEHVNFKQVKYCGKQVPSSEESSNIDLLVMALDFTLGFNDLEVELSDNLLLFEVSSFGFVFGFEDFADTEALKRSSESESDPNNPCFCFPCFGKLPLGIDGGAVIVEGIFA